MKSLLKYACALVAALFVVPAYAGTEAGDDSARHYRSYPDKYDGKKVDVDCVFVTRINGRPGIEGVVFFIAHTVDKENHAPGGSIVVAVLEADAENFMRKYGTTMGPKPRKGGKVDSTRLRGTFHQLKGGKVYIDESGEAHALIEAHSKEKGMDAIPDADDADGPRSR